MIPRPHLVLFFTYGVSLQTWMRVGMLEREIAIYQRMVERGCEVSFLTYGNSGDLGLGGRMPGIKILCNHRGLPGWIYARLAHRLHGGILREADLVKSNQTRGADLALKAARLWRKPFIARCGYMWSDLAAHGGPGRAAEARKAKKSEQRVFCGADAVSVTTPSMREYALSEYSLPPERVKVVPNYVLTDLFRPGGERPVAGRICFVGRLGPEKNPLLMVDACSGLEVELVVVGDGPLRAELETQAQIRGVKLRILGNLPHGHLPKVLTSAEVFLLLSPHEGHPKALLEAMSCGLTVVGANSPGIRELILHGETGMLCNPDAGAVKSTLAFALSQPTLRAELGARARRYVLDNFSLDRVVEIEMDLVNEVLDQRTNG